MELEQLETQRLILKKLTPEILADLFANSPDPEIKKLLGLNSDEELLIEKRKSEGGYKTYDRTIVSFVLVLKDTNEVIGRGGFHNWYKDHFKAELGYTLNKDVYKRNGFMTEAVNAILKYGFETMQLNRIEACIGTQNIASLSLIKKFGFTREGLLRQHYVRDGEIQDSFLFSLLKEDMS